MKPTRTMACAALLLTSALARAETAPPPDHGAMGQSHPAQGETGKPCDMKCPMMHDMHGEMKMEGQAMPQGAGGKHQPGMGSGGMNDMADMREMKCMQDGTAAEPTPQPAPQEKHSHDHSEPAPR